MVFRRGRKRLKKSVGNNSKSTHPVTHLLCQVFYGLSLDEVRLNWRWEKESKGPPVLVTFFGWNL